MRWFARFLATVLMSAAVTESAHAQILFSDSFNRTTGIGDGNTSPVAPGTGNSNWGQNDNALGGSVTQTYLVGPLGRTGGANQVVGPAVLDATIGSVGHLLDGGVRTNGAIGIPVNTLAM